jgi:carbon-monoxide dehydrogenase large subunit
LNAVNDALSSLGASIWQMPMTPERILNAIDEGTDGQLKKQK